MIDIGKVVSQFSIFISFFLHNLHTFSQDFGSYFSIKQTISVNYHTLPSSPRICSGIHLFQILMYLFLTYFGFLPSLALLVKPLSSDFHPLPIAHSYCLILNLCFWRSTIRLWYFLNLQVLPTLRFPFSKKYFDQYRFSFLTVTFQLFLTFSVYNRLTASWTCLPLQLLPTLNGYSLQLLLDFFFFCTLTQQMMKKRKILKKMMAISSSSSLPSAFFTLATIELFVGTFFLSDSIQLREFCSTKLLFIHFYQQIFPILRKTTVFDPLSCPIFSLLFLNFLLKFLMFSSSFQDLVHQCSLPKLMFYFRSQQAGSYALMSDGCRERG